MRSAKQRGSAQTGQAHLTEIGMARFEVRGLSTDRDLIRTIAKCLEEGGPTAAKIRAILHSALPGELSPKGGILAALRRSPVAGSGLDPTRTHEEARKPAP